MGSFCWRWLEVRSNGSFPLMVNFITPGIWMQTRPERRGRFLQLEADENRLATSPSTETRSNSARKQRPRRLANRLVFRRQVWLLVPIAGARYVAAGD